MAQYTKKGLYNSYDKNNKERDKLDYYATPPQETYNILTSLGIDFSGQKILEPCCGGGHMVKGIKQYLAENNQEPEAFFATDIHEHIKTFPFDCLTGEEYDFLSDIYSITDIDWIIMNPPYSTIEPFTIRALEIADKGVILLGRLQFLEGKGRFSSIFNENPPNDVYVYIDRIQCWRGGVEPDGSSAQAYAWFVWDKSKPQGTQVHWLHRDA